MRHPLAVLLVASTLGVLGAGRTASAAPITISLDTSALIGGSTGPYYLDFQLIDGDGIANTLVDIGSFNFFGGSAVPSATVNGNASGDISSAVSLGDGSFFNGLFQGFVPGAALTFVVDFTSSGSDVVPDQFSFAILNADLFGIGAGPGGEFLSINFFSTPVTATYAGTGEFGDPVLAAPTATSVPEPTTLMLLGLGAAVAGITRARRLPRRQD